MNNDLISREALKFELRQHLAYHKERAKLTTLNNVKMSHSLVATGIQLAIDSIDIAPTVELPPAEWKINTITGDIFCSRCKTVRRDTRKEHVYYCNHCGARMLRASEVIT